MGKKLWNLRKKIIFLLIFSLYLHYRFVLLAQLVLEQNSHKVQVVGSNPTGNTKFIYHAATNYFQPSSNNLFYFVICTFDMAASKCTSRYEKYQESNVQRTSGQFNFIISCNISYFQIKKLYLQYEKFTKLSSFVENYQNVSKHFVLCWFYFLVFKQDLCDCL